MGLIEASAALFFILRVAFEYGSEFVKCLLPALIFQPPGSLDVKWRTSRRPGAILNVVGQMEPPINDDGSDHLDVRIHFGRLYHDELRIGDVSGICHACSHSTSLIHHSEVEWNVAASNRRIICKGHVIHH